jgi:molybdate/tungstate transport system substrate-binding protein
MRSRASAGPRRAAACLAAPRLARLAAISGLAWIAVGPGAAAAIAGEPSSDPAPASTAPAAPREEVAVRFGPSLAHVVQQRLAPDFEKATGVAVRTAVATPLAEADLGGADVALVTDPEMLMERSPKALAPYYVVFAANAMVVGYRRDSTYGKAIAAGMPWFEALRTGGVRFGRLDPALDPLGARAIFVLQLARTYYETADLVQQILRPHQIVAAGDLLPKLERGELDAALLYRSQAVEARLAILDLPIEINLSDPGRRGVYSNASVDAGGDVVRGGPIAVAAVPLESPPHPAAALRFVDYLSSGPARRILYEVGYVVLPGFPMRRVWGQAP